MNSEPDLAMRVFPPRVADLGFCVELPADWVAHDLPPELPDFSVTTAFAPLSLVAAPHAALVFAVAARPAFEDGTLDDWVGYLLGHEGLTPSVLERGALAGVAARIGEATQDSELGPMRVRFAFFEDGGRLVNVTLSAPAMLADAVAGVWAAILRSLRLAMPRGSRFAIEAEPVVASAAAAPIEPEPRVEVEVEAEEAAATPVEPVERTFAEFALADDTAALDPEHATNRNLRDRGVGLVPRVHTTDDAARCATVASGAIVATFPVPYGWHVIDDGRRALVFEPTGRVQLHLSRLDREGRDDDGMLDAIEQQMRHDYPAPEFVRVAFGPITALGARGIADGEQPLEQYHMLLQCPSSEQVLRARVTATPETARDACDLAELVLLGCRFLDTLDAEVSAVPIDRPIDGPQWWRDAQQLERDDRCAEAERLIEAHVPHAGASVSIAELYKRRMVRLLAAGDRDGAAAAFRKADESMWCYASGATSGGEGAARSLERDDFHRELVTAFGGEPQDAEV
ncbi:MAG: hypothetical protein R3F29_08685 [Planctomycetota bacterium]